MRKPFKKSGSGSGGPGSFVLIVGDEGAILVQMQRKRVVRRLFAQSPDPQHTRGFDEVLAASPRASVTLLIDMMDQSYVRQTLPPVSSFSVGKIVRRRLDKDFSSNDIKGYLILGREKNGRKDWNYLMVSLANPPLLQKWIAFAVERSNPFKGLGLVPLESQPFIIAAGNTFLKDMGKDAKPLEWQILVNHHKVGGFRQVVLRNGKLVFTRMAQPIGESLPDVIAGNIEQELTNTFEYLKRMGLHDPSTLSVIIVASEEIKQALDPKNIKAGQYHYFTPHEIAQLLSLTDAAQPEDHFGDVVISAFVSTRRKLLLPLQTTYTKRLKKLFSFILMVRVAAALGGLAIAGWAGMTGWDMLTARENMEKLEAEHAALKNKLVIIKEQAKSLPTKINTFSDVVTMSKLYFKRKYDLLSFVNDFSDALQKNALVKEIHWSLSDPLGASADNDKREWQSEASVFLTTPLEPRAPFLAAAQTLIERLEKSFTGFAVSHSELPGLLSDSKELKTVIDEKGSTPAAANTPLQNEAIKITIKGPLQASPTASPAGKAAGNGR